MLIICLVILKHRNSLYWFCYGCHSFLSNDYKNFETCNLKSFSLDTFIKPTMCKIWVLSGIRYSYFESYSSVIRSLMQWFLQGALVPKKTLSMRWFKKECHLGLSSKEWQSGSGVAHTSNHKTTQWDACTCHGASCSTWFKSAEETGRCYWSKFTSEDVNSRYPRPESATEKCRNLLPPSTLGCVYRLRGESGYSAFLSRSITQENFRCEQEGTSLSHLNGGKGAEHSRWKEGREQRGTGDEARGMPCHSPRTRRPAWEAPGEQQRPRAREGGSTHQSWKSDAALTYRFSPWKVRIAGSASATRGWVKGVIWRERLGSLWSAYPARIESGWGTGVNWEWIRWRVATQR